MSRRARINRYSTGDPITDAGYAQNRRTLNYVLHGDTRYGVQGLPLKQYHRQFAEELGFRRPPRKQKKSIKKRFQDYLDVMLETSDPGALALSLDTEFAPTEKEHAEASIRAIIQGLASMGEAIAQAGKNMAECLAEFVKALDVAGQATQKDFEITQ